MLIARSPQNCLMLHPPFTSTSKTTFSPRSIWSSTCDFSVPQKRSLQTSSYSKNSPFAIFCLNSSGVRKKYSTPFCSVPRGARLVQEIEKWRLSSGCSFISHCTMVLFPEPEGALKIRSLPVDPPLPSRREGVSACERLADLLSTEGILSFSFILFLILSNTKWSLKKTSSLLKRNTVKPLVASHRLRSSSFLCCSSVR